MSAPKKANLSAAKRSLPLSCGKALDFGPGHKAPKTPVGGAYTRDLLQMLEWNDVYRKSDESQRFEADRVRRESLAQVADRMIRTHGLSEVSPQDHRDLVWQLSVRNGIRNERGGRTLLEAGWTPYIDNKITTRRGRIYRLRRGNLQNLAWPGGPKSRRKSVDHDLDDYIGWLIKFEYAYGSSERDAPFVVSRLRRMFFSRHSGVAGARFEQLLRTPEEPPASTKEPDQGTLDRIFETDQIVTPSGKIDPSHIFAMLDLELTGPTVLGEGRHIADNMSVAGTVTWVGDLASWFTEWNFRRKAFIPREPGQIGEFDFDRLFYSLVESKVSQEYNKDAGASDGRRRFEAFVPAARPLIPHRMEGGKPTILRSAARETLFSNLKDTANLFAATTTRERVSSAVVDSDEIRMHAAYLLRIADHFLKFLEDGLSTGRPVWPPRSAP